MTGGIKPSENLSKGVIVIKPGAEHNEEFVALLRQKLAEQNLTVISEVEVLLTKGQVYEIIPQLGRPCKYGDEWKKPLEEYMTSSPSKLLGVTGSNVQDKLLEIKTLIRNTLLPQYTAIKNLLHTTDPDESTAACNRIFKAALKEAF